MAADLKPLQDYIQDLQKKQAQGDATEHTYRPALQVFIEGLAVGISVTNEPKHVDCGAPDFVIKKGVTTIGYIEVA